MPLDLAAQGGRLCVHADQPVLDVRSHVSKKDHGLKPAKSLPRGETYHTIFWSLWKAMAQKLVSIFWRNLSPFEQTSVLFGLKGLRLHSPKKNETWKLKPAESMSWKSDTSSCNLSRSLSLASLLHSWEKVSWPFFWEPHEQRAFFCRASDSVSCLAYFDELHSMHISFIFCIRHSSFHMMHLNCSLITLESSKPSRMLQSSYFGIYKLNVFCLCETCSATPLLRLMIPHMGGHLTSQSVRKSQHKDDRLTKQSMYEIFWNTCQRLSQET